MVPRGGIEPPTRGFSVPCSTDWAIWAFGETYFSFSRNSKFQNVVGISGLEPPASRLSGVRSNQLSYTPTLEIWKMVGVAGFEPAALWSQTRCATKLRYTPKISCWILKKRLAGETGFEPATLGFGDRCSTSWATLLFVNGGPSGTRTPDHPVMSRML